MLNIGCDLRGALHGLLGRFMVFFYVFSGVDLWLSIGLECFFGCFVMEVILIVLGYICSAIRCSAAFVGVTRLFGVSWLRSSLSSHVCCLC